MKKLLGFMLLCAMSVSLSSCSDSDNSKKNAEEKQRVGRYTNPRGGRQEYYKGSVEQQQDLAEIDAYFDEHGWY